MSVDVIEVGRQVSHYRITGLVGIGGMGVVYKAEDLRLGRTVALKFLSRLFLQDRQARERFMIEARALSALDHPAICGIHDIEETPDGDMFICMPYYEGETLATRLEHGALSTQDALDIVIKTADGLASAHARGITHRDIKPSNIMLVNDDVKILDFGLAKLRGTTTITHRGDMVGTCAYISPEQADGLNPVDGRTDVFSLGVVLYECLTGKKPFDGEHCDAVLYQIRNVDPFPLKKFIPGIRDELQHIVSQAIEKDPSRRYQTMAAFRADLESFAAGYKVDVAQHRVRLAATITGVAVVMSLALVPGLATYVWHQIVGEPASSTVVVLPFDNVGKDPMNQAFCDGLTEILASQVAQLQSYRPRLSVVPPIAARERGVSTPAQANRVLGVTDVLTGSVQRLGGQLRVTLSLIDVAHGAVPKQKNSAVIDTPTMDQKELQDEAVMYAARMLRIEIDPEEKQAVDAGTTNVSSAYGFYAQGMGYLSHYESGDNLDRAVESLSMAVDHDSTYALAHAALGEAYWRKYRETGDTQWIDPAQDNALTACKLDDALARGHVVMGWILAGTNQEQPATREFQRAIAIEPANSDAISGLAGVYESQKRLAEAEATYRRAIAAKPRYWGGYHELGKFFYRQGEYDKAITAWENVTRLTPHNQFAYGNLGAAYQQMGNFRSARDMYQRSIEEQPNYRAYANLGALTYVLGDYAASARACEKALELNDKSYMSWVNLGNAYYWIPGKRPEAQKAFARAAELAEAQRKLTPGDASLLASLAGYYAILGQKDSALALINECTRLAPDNARVQYFAGHAYEQLGQRDLAIARIGDALKKGYARPNIETDPFMHELRKDPRYIEIAEASSKRE